MHELSIAMGIVKIAEDETRKAGARSVELIELEIGRLAGIELDSLEFVWPVAVEGTVLNKADKKINVIDGLARCMDCQQQFKLEQVYDCCPACGSGLKEVIKGKELRVLALEVA